jgi:hypothetical protein
VELAVNISHDGYGRFYMDNIALLDKQLFNFCAEGLDGDLRQ